VVDEVLGNSYDAPSQAQLDFAIAYSYCSQQVWGEWDYGFWKSSDAIPSADPERPLMTWFANACPETMNTLLLPFR
jgi:hypothetical protein